MAKSRFFTGKLDSLMADDLHLGRMSERTHAGYLRAVRQLADDCQTPATRTLQGRQLGYFGVSRQRMILRTENSIRKIETSSGGRTRSVRAQRDFNTKTRPLPRSLDADPLRIGTSNRQRRPRTTTKALATSSERQG